MKRTIIISTFLSMCFIMWKGYENIIFAQTNNLYFNQVINQAVNSTPTCYTVPAGKVFKLEGIAGDVTATAYLEFGSACGSVDYGQIYLPNNTIHIGKNNSGDQAWPFPIWCKAGTRIATSAGTVYISGIEFNVAP